MANKIRNIFRSGNVPLFLTITDIRPNAGQFTDPVAAARYQIKSNQVFISPAATEILYTVDIVLYISNKHNVNGYKYQKFTDGAG